MPSAAIIVFSGTGNTWQIAERYRQALEGLGLRANVLRLERLDRDGHLERLGEYDLIGFGYPVHAWGLPRFVAQALSALPLSEGQPAFLFATAGRQAGRALEAGKRQLSSRGYQVTHQAHYYTGSYYFDPRERLLSADQLTRRQSWLQRDVTEAAMEIISGKERRLQAPSGCRSLAMELAWRAYLLGCRQARRHLFADGKCTRCGLCVDSCPTQNLSMESQNARSAPLATAASQVVVGAACTLCLRCVSICPVAAMQLTRRTEKMGRYLAPGFLAALGHDESATIPDTP